MGQRIGNALDESFVEFGAFARGLELDLLAELLRQIAHHPRETREHHRHGHHADRHHGFLQIAGVAFELRQTSVQALENHRINIGSRLRQHGLRNNQLANQIDQLVNFIHADANGRIATTRRCGDGSTLAVTGGGLSHRAVDGFDRSQSRGRRRIRNRCRDIHEKAETIAFGAGGDGRCRGGNS